MADTLTISAGTFLMATNTASTTGGFGIHLDNRGAWTVNVHGHLFSYALAGIYLDAGNAGLSTITISGDGSVTGFLAGITVGGLAATPTLSPVNVTNNGTIVATAVEGVGIHLNSPGAHTIVNTGAILADFAVVSQGAAADTVTNSGWMEGSVYLSDGTNILTNTGSVGQNADLRSYIGGMGADTIVNNLTFAGGVLSGNGVAVEGANKLTNAGLVGKDWEGLSFVGGHGGDSIENKLAGVMTGAFDLRNGVNTVLNYGRIGQTLGDAWVKAGNGADTVTNHGTITGALYLGATFAGPAEGTNILYNYGDLGADLDNFSYSGGASTDSVYNGSATYRDASIAGGVDLASGTNVVDNYGSIGRTAAPSDPGFVGYLSVTGGGGADTVTNRGTIEGGVFVGTGSTIGTNIFTNTGSVGASTDALSFVGDNGTDTINNSAMGSFAGGVYVDDGSNSFTNAGTVGNASTAHSYYGGNGTDTITNTGTFSGFVQAGDGLNRLDNSNRIGADTFGVSYVGGSGDDTVNNKDTLVLDATMMGGIILGGGKNSVSNSGFIGAAVVDGGDSSTLDGISVLGSTGIDTIVNSGVLDGSVVIGYIGDTTGTNILNNSGTIRRDTFWNSYSGGDGADTVTNSRTMTGAIYLGNGTNVITNSGSIGESDIDFAIDGGSGNDTVTNTKPGWISGRLTMGNGDNALTNSGTVWHDVANKITYVGGSGKDTINNTNKLSGSLHMGDGANLLINSGTVGTGTDIDYQGGLGLDDVRNTGKILGAVVLGDGTNLLVNSGTVGAVDGGANSDTFTNELTGKMGRVVLGDGINTLTNKGLLDQGGLGIVGSSAVGSEDKIINSGTILGFLDLAGGKNSLNNSGVIGLDVGLHSYLAVDGTNAIVNSKSLLGGLQLVGGINALTNTGTIGADISGNSYHGYAGAGTGASIIANGGKCLGPS